MFYFNIFPDKLPIDTKKSQSNLSCTSCYNDIREKSLNQWLDEMEKHEDIAVRGGVKLAREYVQHLRDEIDRLKGENELKNSYLKKISKRK